MSGSSAPVLTPYPVDYTGTASTNLITGEQQALKLPTFENFHFLIPDFAPYFASSLQVSIQNLDGSVQNLTEGIDYYCTNQFVAASKGCALPIYGSVSFLNLKQTGIVTFNYQTLGGIWTIDSQEISQILADTLHNPRVTTWDQVTEQPVTFPPVAHTFDLTNVSGSAQFITELQNVEAAIRANTYNTTLLTQAVDTSNNAANVANQAIITAQAALATSQALDPTVAAETLTALQTAIATAEGTLPAQLTSQVAAATATANNAAAAVVVLQRQIALNNSASDDYLYFVAQG